MESGELCVTMELERKLQSDMFVYTAGGGSGSTWIDRLCCSGGESDLSQCSFSGWGENNCDHNEDLGVWCGNVVDNCARLKLFYEISRKVTTRCRQWNESLYWTIEKTMNWDEAESTCGAVEGGHLASVHSDEELGVLHSLGVRHPHWIGLRTHGCSSHIWNWSDGSRIDYTKWNTDEPSCTLTNPENCVELWNNGFNDAPCDWDWNMKPLCSALSTAV